jgi:hypothetical protein
MDVTDKKEFIPPPPEDPIFEDPWKLYTLKDAYAERPPTPYILSGIFKIPSLNIIYSAPGDMKTMLMIDLCGCVVAGVPWLPAAPWQPGGEPFKTIKSPVLWLDFDNGDEEMLPRIEAIGRTLNLPEGAPFYSYIMPQPWLNAGNIEHVSRVADRAIRLETKLIIIDNLGSVSGGIDENSSQMIQVMSNLRQLSQNSGAAVVVIHHQRKGNGIKGGRAGDALRGHSSIEAAINLALHVERSVGSDTINIRSTKIRGTDVLPFGAVFTFTHKPGTDELETFRFFGLKGSDNSSSAALKREILDALRGESLNQSNLVKVVKDNGIEAGRDRIIEMIQRMEINKQIISSEGSRNAKIYSLPSVSLFP